MAPKVLDVNLARYASGGDPGMTFSRSHSGVLDDKGINLESMHNSEKLQNVSRALVALEGARRVKLSVHRY